MNQTINGVTVKCFHHEEHAQFKCHLALFIDAYITAQRL